MNKALLPTLARLHSLQVTSRVGPDRARIVASRSDPTPITVVLREINETVLARALHFTSENGSRLSIEASGRRILRVTAAEGLPEAEACLGATSLDDAHKDDLIRLLQAFSAPRHEIRVKTAPLSSGSDGISVGLPIALVADLLLVELNGLDAELVSETTPQVPANAPQQRPEFHAEENRLARFARNFGGGLMAWLILGGTEDGSAEGPEEMVDHLRSFLAEERKGLVSQLDQVSASPGDPVCLALGARLSAGHSIVCARFEDSILLGLAEGNCVQSLTGAWSAALA